MTETFPPFTLQQYLKPAATLVVGLVATFTLYIVGLSIYRLFFHPLSKYPGPFLAKISNWHAVIHAQRGDRHINQYELHKKYGPIVRMGPERISINQVDAIKDIYGINSNLLKSDFYTTGRPGGPNDPNASVVGTRDRKMHAELRRIMGHAFSESALRTLEPYILDKIERFTEIMGDPQMAWQDMGNYATWLTFDIMGELAFGKTFGMMDGEENRNIPHDIDADTATLLKVGSYPLIDRLGLAPWLFPQSMKGRLRFRAYARAQLEARMANGSKRVDVLHHLLNARDKVTGKALTQQLLFMNAAMLIIAASDTTATAIAANFYYLTKCPETLSKLTAEIRSKFSSVDEIVLGKQLESCSYLKAVVDESLRKSPSVPGGVYRVTVETGLHTCGGYFPPGTEMVVPIWAIHHNDEYYQEPWNFAPERWLKEGKELETAAFNPFSIGARGCLGKRLAYIELYLTLARTVFLYDLEYVGGGDEDRIQHNGVEFKLFDHFTASKEGPLVKFSPRKV